MASAYHARSRPSQRAPWGSSGQHRPTCSHSVQLVTRAAAVSTAAEIGHVEELDLVAVLVEIDPARRSRSWRSTFSGAAGGLEHLCDGVKGTAPSLEPSYAPGGQWWWRRPRGSFSLAARLSSSAMTPRVRGAPSAGSVDGQRPGVGVPGLEPVGEDRVGAAARQHVTVGVGVIRMEVVGEGFEGHDDACGGDRRGEGVAVALDSGGAGGTADEVGLSGLEGTDVTGIGTVGESLETN